VRLLKLAPGAEIREHRDVGISMADEEARLHIPIITNDETDFLVGGQRLSMRPGECWYVNVDLPHSVMNRGRTDRVHLIVDVVVDAWLRSAVRARSSDVW
jgi:aspartyl/asparaginyl beta-hydroxylase (cupin superfamily)